MGDATCKQCGCVTEPPKPGQIRLGGTRHNPSCPTLPHLTPGQQASLNADLAEIAACHRRAEAASRNIWIG